MASAGPGAPGGELDRDTLPYAVLLVILTGMTLGFAGAQPMTAIHTQALHQSCPFWSFEDSCLAVKTSTDNVQCEWNWDEGYGVCEYSGLCHGEYSANGCLFKGCAWFEEGDLAYCFPVVGWSSTSVGIFCAVNIVGLLLGCIIAINLESKMGVSGIVDNTLLMFVLLLFTNGFSLYLFGFAGKATETTFVPYCFVRMMVAVLVGFASVLVPQLSMRAFPPSMRREPAQIIVCCAACSFAFSIGLIYALEGVVWIVGGIEVCCVVSTCICIGAILVLQSEFNALAARTTTTAGQGASLRKEADSDGEETGIIHVEASGMLVPQNTRNRARFSLLTSIFMAVTSECCGLTIYAFYMPDISVFLGMAEMNGAMWVAIVNAFFTLFAAMLPTRFVPFHTLSAMHRYVIAVGSICALLLVLSYSLRTYLPGEDFDLESLTIFLHVGVYHLLFLPADSAAVDAMLTMGMRRSAKVLRTLTSGVCAAAIVGIFPILTRQMSHMNDSMRILNPQRLQHSIADILTMFSVVSVVCAVTVSLALRRSISSHTGYKKSLID